MLSARLMQRVEQNWERIASAVIEQSRRDTHIRHYACLDEAEIRARAQDVIGNLGRWLSRPDEAELRHRYRDLGWRRREEGFPLEEVIYKLQTIEWKIVQYVQDENPPENSVQLYGELEMSRVLHRFFGIVVHSVVCGYQRGRELPLAKPSARQLEVV